MVMTPTLIELARRAGRTNPILILSIHSHSFPAIYRNDMTGTNISHESGSERTCIENPKSVVSVSQDSGLVAFGGVPFRYVVNPPHMAVHSQQQLSSRVSRHGGEGSWSHQSFPSPLLCYGSKKGFGCVRSKLFRQGTVLASDCPAP